MILSAVHILYNIPYNIYLSGFTKIDLQAIYDTVNKKNENVRRRWPYRVSGVLKSSQLHLGLQGARRELAPIARVLEVAALPQVGVVDVPEGHEGAQELGEGPRHGDVVGGRAGGDAGDLRVHGRVGEHQAPAAEKDLLVGDSYSALSRVT